MAGIAEVPDALRRIGELEAMVKRIVDELNQHYKKHHNFKEKAIP